MRKVVFLLTIILSLFLINKPVLGVECQPTDSKDSGTLQEIINACNSKLTEIGDKKNTLSSQIQYMDTQISVSQLEINKNQNEIARIKKEIKNLSSRIVELNSTTDKISDTVKLKITRMYKRQQTNPVYTFLNANNLPKFLRSIQYLRRSQISDRELLLKLQNTKVTFSEQKDLREEKELELNELSARLENYKADLASQQVAKQQLLSATQNDEKRYQQLLSDAQRQIASFKSFVQSAGGSTVGANGLGTGYDGNYFSQRDERWAGSQIGSSSENILDVGCLVTSVAMVLKHKGVDVSPADIAGNSGYYFSTTAYMLKPTYNLPGGYTRSSIAISDIENQLNSNNPVIVGVYHGAYGTHFVVLKKTDGDDYIMFDPVYGPDKKFSEIYSKDVIFEANVLN